MWMEGAVVERRSGRARVLGAEDAMTPDRDGARERPDEDEESHAYLEAGMSHEGSHRRSVYVLEQAIVTIFASSIMPAWPAIPSTTS
jgi:hypothetical protein